MPPNPSQNVSVPRSLTFSTTPYHDLTFVSSVAQQLETRDPQTWADVLGEHYTPVANKREEGQELEARIPPFISSGISAVKGVFKGRDVSVSDDTDTVYNAALHHLLTREPEPYVMSHPDFYQTRDLADDIGKVGINDLPDIL